MKYFIPAILWAVLILVLSGMPGNAMPSFDWWHLFQPDKVGHVVVYAILTGLLLWGTVKKIQLKPLPKNTIVTVVLIAVLYGISMECMQWQFFPGRNFDVLDIIANIIGSFAGLACLRFF